MIKEKRFDGDLMGIWFIFDQTLFADYNGLLSEKFLNF